MSAQTKVLLRWADALDSGRFEQMEGNFFDPGHPERACVLGVGFLSVDPGAREHLLSPRFTEHPFCHNGYVRGLGLTPDIEAGIASAIATQNGITFEGPWGVLDVAVADLNDHHGIDFPTFARAIRAVARQIEEHEPGEPMDRSTREAYSAIQEAMARP